MTPRPAAVPLALLACVVFLTACAQPRAPYAFEHTEDGATQHSAAFTELLDAALALEPSDPRRAQLFAIGDDAKERADRIQAAVDRLDGLSLTRREARSLDLHAWRVLVFMAADLQTETLNTHPGLVAPSIDRAPADRSVAEIELRAEQFGRSAPDAGPVLAGD